MSLEERNLAIIESVMQELGVSDIEELPAKAHELVESRRTLRALDEVHAERTMSMSCPACHRLIEVVLLASLRQ